MLYLFLVVWYQIGFHFLIYMAPVSLETKPFICLLWGWVMERKSKNVQWWIMCHDKWKIKTKFICAFFFLGWRGIALIKSQVNKEHKPGMTCCYQLCIRITFWMDLFVCNKIRGNKKTVNDDWRKQCHIKLPPSPSPKKSSVFFPRFSVLLVNRIPNQVQILETGICSERGWHNWRFTIDHHHWWEIICGKSNSTLESEAQVRI